METYTEIANSPILWAITILAITLVLVQALIILRKSIIAGKQLGIETDAMKSAFKTGAISSVGPSIVIVIGMASLLIVVGAPTALMRLSYIGNVAFELLSVQFASEAYGVDLVSGSMTPEIFCVALWCMSIGCIGWIVVTALFTDKMSKITEKFTGKSAKTFAAVSSGVMLGAYGYLNAGYVVSMNQNTIAMIGGAIVMFIMTRIYKRKKKRWINEWSLTIAMIGGVIFAVML